jgi:hypothetical protein
LPNRVELIRAGRCLLTPHPPEAYPGVRVVWPGPDWEEGLIVATEGQSFIALGGERIYAYETIGGVRAQGFVLEAGDQATALRTGLPAHLVEWRIELSPGAATTTRLSSGR